MSTFDHWRDQLLRAVADASLLGHPRRVRLANGRWQLEGTLTIAGRTVTIALVVDPLFENKLPTVRLQPWDALGFIPHVDPSGVICYVDPEGMLLDQRRQLQIVRECLAEVRRTLLAGVTGANRADFVDEFEVYWQYLTPHLTAISSLDAYDLVTEVVIATAPDPQHLCAWLVMRTALCMWRLAQRRAGRGQRSAPSICRLSQICCWCPHDLTDRSGHLRISARLSHTVLSRTAHGSQYSLPRGRTIPSIW